MLPLTWVNEVGLNLCGCGFDCLKVGIHWIEGKVSIDFDIVLAIDIYHTNTVRK